MRCGDRSAKSQKKIKDLSTLVQPAYAFAVEEATNKRPPTVDVVAVEPWQGAGGRWFFPLKGDKLFIPIRSRILRMRYGGSWSSWC
jgi:hypothetical protein